MPTGLFYELKPYMATQVEGNNVKLTFLQNIQGVLIQ